MEIREETPVIEDGSILVINCGSSSIKFSVIDHERDAHLIRGSVERIGKENGRLKWTAADRTGSQSLGAVNHQAALLSIAAILNDTTILQKKFIAIGHRVVHGGETFAAPSQVDDQVLSAIENCNPLAPCIILPTYWNSNRAASLSRATRVAVFDTSFHQTLPQRAVSTRCRTWVMRNMASVATVSMARAIDL